MKSRAPSIIQTSNHKNAIKKTTCTRCQQSFQTQSGLYKHKMTSYCYKSENQKNKVGILNSFPDKEQKIVSDKQLTLEQFKKAFQTILGKPKSNTNNQTENILDLSKNQKKLFIEFNNSVANRLFNQILEFLIQQVSDQGFRELIVFLIVWKKAARDLKLENKNQNNNEDFDGESSYESVQYADNNQNSQSIHQRIKQEYQNKTLVRNLFRAANSLVSFYFQQYGIPVLKKYPDPLFAFQEKTMIVNLCRLAMLISRWFVKKGYANKSLKYKHY